MVSSEQMQNIEKEMFSMGMPVEALMEKVGIGISSWILDNQGLLGNGVLVLIGLVFFLLPVILISFKVIKSILYVYGKEVF